MFGSSSIDQSLALNFDLIIRNLSRNSVDSTKTMPSTLLSAAIECSTLRALNKTKSGRNQVDHCVQVDLVRLAPAFKFIVKSYTWGLSGVIDYRLSYFSLGINSAFFSSRFKGWRRQHRAHRRHRQHVSMSLCCPGHQIRCQGLTFYLSLITPWPLFVAQLVKHP